MPIARLLLALTLLLSVGCDDEPALCESEGEPCMNGTICAEGVGCVLRAQLDACVAQADGELCSFAGFVGACSTGVCLAVLCGDGRVDFNEICDDGNAMAGDGCSADCLSDETCGNGVVDQAVGEECDDVNDASGDGCFECALE